MTDSAVWMTCRDCGHTTRALALMASRVLKTRTHCPECSSTCEPCLNRTPAGRGITLSKEQALALREMDDKDVRGWLEQEARSASTEIAPLQWMQAAGCRLADRFARGVTARRALHSGDRAAGSSQAQTCRKQSEGAFHDPGTIVETGSAAIRL